MVALVKLSISISVVLCFISTASGKCGLNDFVIGTVRSGNTRAGATEWNVEIVNNCNCAQSNVLVSCQGFQSVEPVNPTIFLKKGNECIVNQGRPIPPKGSVKFSYAWDPPFLLRPFSSTAQC